MIELYDLFKNSNGVSIDTRTLQEGALFFCLNGENFNGHKFAEQAIEKGACYVIIDDPEYYSNSHKMILVDNSLQTLQRLASYHRDQYKIPIIGITGTNGKTTTKELVSAVLTQKYQVLFTQGNFNNHIGVPLTLLQIKDYHDIAVIEMGANHVGEIAELCEWVKPNYGILTNVGHAHLEGFGSFDNVFLTKKALYAAVAKQSGFVFVNADDDLLLNESMEISRSTYGCSNNSDIQVELQGNSLELELNWNGGLIKTHLFGEYNLSNAAAAIAIGVYFKVENEKIKTALEGYCPSNNRSQIIKGVHNEIIMDAYNANPDSMKAAIGFFKEVSFDQKALVLGDMLELGEFEEKEHHDLLLSLLEFHFSVVLLVGPAFYQFKNEFSQFHFFMDSESCNDFVIDKGYENYKILLKGSRGIRLEFLKESLL